MKKILICILKALIATLLILLILFIIIKIGLWIFKLNPVIGILILFVIIVFMSFFDFFYNDNCEILEKYIKRK